MRKSELAPMFKQMIKSDKGVSKMRMYYDNQHFMEAGENWWNFINERTLTAYSTRIRSYTGRSLEPYENSF